MFFKLIFHVQAKNLPDSYIECSVNYHGFPEKFIRGLQLSYIYLDRMKQSLGDKDLLTVMTSLKHFYALSAFKEISPALELSRKYVIFKAMQQAAKKGNVHFFRQWVMGNNLFNDLNKSTMPVMLKLLKMVEKTDIKGFVSEISTQGISGLSSVRFLLESLICVQKKQDSLQSFSDLFVKHWDKVVGNDRVNSNNLGALIRLLQNNPEEWMNEAAQFHEIYESFEQYESGHLKTIFYQILSLKEELFAALKFPMIHPIHIDEFIKECQESRQFFKGRKDDSDRLKHKQELIDVFLPLQKIILSCKFLLSKNSSDEVVGEYFVTKYIQEYFTSAVSNHEIPDNIHLSNINERGWWFLSLRNNTILNQCLQTNASSLKGWSLEELSSDKLDFILHPSVEIFLEGPDSILHFSKLNKFMAKAIAPKDKEILRQDQLREMIRESKQNLGAEKLMPIVHAFMEDEALSLSKMIVRIQYLNQFFGTSIFDVFYSAVMHQKNKLIDDSLEKWQAMADHERFKPKDLQQVVQDFTQQEEVLQPLNKDILSGIAKIYVAIENYAAEESLADKPQDSIKHIIVDVIKKHDQINGLSEDNIRDFTESQSVIMVACLRELYKRFFGIFPYNLQILNCLAILSKQRTFAQIKTGEGKSTILTMMAAFLALKGHQIDIITSSKELALRDGKKFHKFYGFLGLKCGHVESEGLFSRSKNNYMMTNMDIVYGRLSSFEFITLYGMIKTGPDRVTGLERRYDVLFADEMDYLFIEAIDWASRIAMSAGISNEYFKLAWEFVETKQDTSLSSFRRFLSQNLESEEGFISSEELRRWLRSAHRAQSLEENEDYVIHKNEDGDKVIVIVDKNHTGALQHSMQWSDGLHQIVAIKHNVLIPKYDVEPASVVHATFVNKYNKLYGVTGTMGPLYVREELKKVYDVSHIFDAPRYRESRKKVDKHWLLPNKEKQMTALARCVQEQAMTNRPMLIICEHIKESNTVKDTLHEALEGLSLRIQLYNGVQEEDPDVLLALAGATKTITIATNTASRGADIKTTPQSEECGGLYVIVLFPTINLRVEEQCFGRTGRNGKKGEFCYILDAPRVAEKCGRYEDLTIDSWLEYRERRSRQNSRKRMIKIENQDEIFSCQEFISSLPKEDYENIQRDWIIEYDRIDKESHTSWWEDKDVLREFLYLKVQNVWNRLIDTDSDADFKYISPLHHAIKIKHSIAVRSLLLLPYTIEYFYLPVNSKGQSLEQDYANESQEIQQLLGDYLKEHAEDASFSKVMRKAISLTVFHQDGVKNKEIQAIRYDELLRCFTLMTKPSFRVLFEEAWSTVGQEGLIEVLKIALLNQKLKMEDMIVLLRIATKLWSNQSGIEIEKFKKMVGSDDCQTIIRHSSFLADMKILRAREESSNIVISSELKEFEDLAGEVIKYREQMQNVADDQLISKAHSAGSIVPSLAIITEVFWREYQVNLSVADVTAAIHLFHQTHAVARLPSNISKQMMQPVLMALLALNQQKIFLIVAREDIAKGYEKQWQQFFRRLGLSSQYTGILSTEDVYLSNDILYGVTGVFEEEYLNSLIGLRPNVPSLSLKGSVVLVDDYTTLLNPMCQENRLLEDLSASRYQTCSIIWSLYQKFIKKHLDETGKFISSFYAKSPARIESEFRRIYAEVYYQIGLISFDQFIQWLVAAVHADQYQLEEDFTISEDDCTNKRIVLQKEKKTFNPEWAHGLVADLMPKIKAMLEIKNNVDCLSLASITQRVFYQKFSRLYSFAATYVAPAISEVLCTDYGVNLVDLGPENSLDEKAVKLFSRYDDQIDKIYNDILNESAPVIIFCRDIREARLLGIELRSLDYEINVIKDLKESNHLFALAQSNNTIAIWAGSMDQVDINPLLTMGGFNQYCMFLVYSAATYVAQFHNHQLLDQIGECYFYDQRQNITDILSEVPEGLSDGDLVSQYDQRLIGHFKASFKVDIQVDHVGLILNFYCQLPKGLKARCINSWKEFYSSMRSFCKQIKEDDWGQASSEINTQFESFVETFVIPSVSSWKVDEQTHFMENYQSFLSHLKAHNVEVGDFQKQNSVDVMGAGRV